MRSNEKHDIYNVLRKHEGDREEKSGKKGGDTKYGVLYQFIKIIQNRPVGRSAIAFVYLDRTLV